MIFHWLLCKLNLGQSQRMMACQMSQLFSESSIAVFWEETALLSLCQLEHRIHVTAQKSSDLSLHLPQCSQQRGTPACELN